MAGEQTASHVVTEADLLVHKKLGKEVVVGSVVEFDTEELKAEFLAETEAGPKTGKGKVESKKIGGAGELSQLELAYAIVEAVLTDAERIKIVKTTLKKVIGG